MGTDFHSIFSRVIESNYSQVLFTDWTDKRFFLKQFFSGVFFVFTQLPKWMQDFAALFPLKWLTQGMRSVFLPDSFIHQEVAHSWEIRKTAVILVVWTVVGIGFSIKRFKWSNV